MTYVNQLSQWLGILCKPYAGKGGAPDEFSESILGNAERGLVLLVVQRSQVGGLAPALPALAKLPQFTAVLGILDILEQIRIRIPESVPLTNGSGSGSNSGSDIFLC